MKNFFKNIGIFFFSILLGLSILTACTDDKESVTPLSTPSVTCSDHTVSSLSFTWNAVANAIQYGWELFDPSGEAVDGDVTTATSVTITGLQPSTTYTFKLLAYAVVGSTEYSASETTLTATTDDPTRLNTPEVTYTAVGGKVTFSWNAVENAASYAYSCVKSESAEVINEGSTDETSVTLTLEEGEYIFYLSAVPGDDQYSESEVAELNFTVVIDSEGKVELWRVKGTYTSAELGESWQATLVSYSDDTYVLEGWYGVEGYDLEFYLDDNNEAVVTNYWYVNGNYYAVYTGRDGTYYYMYVYYVYGAGYSAFSGDSTSGELRIYASNTSGGYDYFVWGDDSSGITIDDLVGTYTMVSSGSEAITTGGWATFSETKEVSIAKIDENTISMPVPFSYGSYDSDPIVGTVDLDKRTITFSLDTKVYTYYTFCVYQSPSEAVVASFDEEFNITLSDWSLYYNNYAYVYNTKTTLTKSQ